MFLFINFNLFLFVYVLYLLLWQWVKNVKRRPKRKPATGVKRQNVSVSVSVTVRVSLVWLLRWIYTLFTRCMFTFYAFYPQPITFLSFSLFHFVATGPFLVNNDIHHKESTLWLTSSKVFDATLAHGFTLPCLTCLTCLSYRKKLNHTPNCTVSEEESGDKPVRGICPMAALTA